MLARDGDLLERVVAAAGERSAATGSTSSSGVDAPAVSPTVSCPASSSSSSGLSPSISVAIAPFASRDLDEPLRVRAVRGADHEDERRALRRPSPSPRPGGSASRNRCRPRPAGAARRDAFSSASTIGATSSSDSVVCVITATGLSVFSCARLLRRLDHDVESGRSPSVPITSTWSAWPTSATRWPLSA